MATGGSEAALNTTGKNLFSVAATDGRNAGCTSFSVTSDSANTDNVLVLVTGLHDSGEEMPIGPGETVVFRRDQMGIRTVHAKAAANTVAIRYGIVARTGANS